MVITPPIPSRRTDEGYNISTIAFKNGLRQQGVTTNKETHQKTHKKKAQTITHTSDPHRKF